MLTDIPPTHSFVLVDAALLCPVTSSLSAISQQFSDHLGVKRWERTPKALQRDGNVIERPVSNLLRLQNLKVSTRSALAVLEKTCTSCNPVFVFLL